MSQPNHQSPPISPRQIILFTAPTAATFHLALGESLQKAYPKAELVFVSLYLLAVKRLRAKCEHRVVYFPDLVKEAAGRPIDPIRISNIDRALYEQIGANLNIMLTADKTLPHMGRRAEILIQHYATALDQLIGPHTLMVSRMFDCAFLWLSAGITTIKEGWSFGFVSNGVPARSTLALQTPFRAWNLARSQEGEAMLSQAKEMLHRPPSERAHYMQDSSPQKILPAIRENLMVCWHLWQDYRTDTGVVGARDVILNARLLIRRKTPRLRPQMDITNRADVENFEAPYCFFPLQYEPEASILMYSPWFRSQEEAIRLITQALPAGWKLLVKEHPTMMQLRPSQFYKKLKKIPNLRLVSPNIPATPIIQSSKAVFCITGSATLEAKLLDKPAYCLGRPPFHYMLDGSDIGSNGIRLDRFFQLLKNPENRDITAQDFARYAAGTLDAHGCTFSKNGVWQHDDSPENVRIFMEYITACLPQTNE